MLIMMGALEKVHKSADSHFLELLASYKELDAQIITVQDICR